MGKVFVDIELLNNVDVNDALRHVIGEDEIKRIPIHIQVDTGADHLCINENIQEVLKLPFVKYKYAELADGRIVKCEVVGPVDVRFENADCTCRAMVLPGDSAPLLGLIPLESMDVIIDPIRQELVVGPVRPITKI